MSMNRRDMLKAIGAAGAAVVSGSAAKAETTKTGQEFVGVLFDANYCIGCRKCEWACNNANQLPNQPIEAFDDRSVLEEQRDLAPTRYTVVNKYEVAGQPRPIYIKKQCMHCSQPACASACLTAAMKKTTEGPIIWREQKCMGCRYCMVSCPFDIPKFEYDSPNPRISKCSMCWERIHNGIEDEIFGVLSPACVNICPTEALLFGTRRVLVEEGRRRIYENPGKYVHQIYGEDQVGGTGWLYLSPVPFDQLGFNTTLDSQPVPELTKGFLYSVPYIFILWPAILLGLSRANEKSEDSDSGAEGGSHE